MKNNADSKPAQDFDWMSDPGACDWPTCDCTEADCCSGMEPLVKDSPAATPRLEAPQQKA